MQNNFADWAVCDAMSRDDPVEKTPDILSRRLMTLNFAAIHTSTMTIANMILDIASGSAGKRCLTAVFTECQALTQSYGTQWSSTRIAEMVITDSALRESMRISGFGSQAFVRKVTAQTGITLPNGIHIAQGKILCVSGYSMHHDESIYAEPHEFRYDRFLQPLAGGKESHRQAGTQVKSAVTTDVTYGVWGHGRHACPGRFFAVHLVKMVVAYIVQNYELEPWDERPANSWIGDTPIPPRNLMMGVRRR